MQVKKIKTETAIKVSFTTFTKVYVYFAYTIYQYLEKKYDLKNKQK